MRDLNVIVAGYTALDDATLCKKVSALEDVSFITFIRFVEPNHLVRLNSEIYYRFGELYKSPRYKDLFTQLAKEHHNA